MTLTFTVQMRTDKKKRNSCLHKRLSQKNGAFTLIELVVAMAVIGLFIAIAQQNLFGMLRKNTFRAQIQDFVSTMQMAATAAAESNRRYEVIINLAEQSYMLRQITSADLADYLEEEIIVDNDFSDNCWVSYVLFDDGEFTNEAIAKFRVGHSGWQYGGVIVFFDKDKIPYSVVVTRINILVTLQQEEAEPLETKSRDQIPF